MALRSLYVETSKNSTASIKTRAIQAAQAAQARFGNLAAYLPAYGKIYRLRSDQSGIHGNFYADGVTGAMIAPIPGSPLRFLDCDAASAVALALKTIPRLAETLARRSCPQRVAFAFCAPNTLNWSRHYTDQSGVKHEFMSLRGPGYGLLWTGSLHVNRDGSPSGLEYTDNDQKIITLNQDEISALMALNIDAAPPIKPSPKIVAATNANRLLHDLSYISPDRSRRDWLKIGGILKDLYGDAGLPIWDTWSQGSATKYKEGETAEKWKSLRKSGGATPKTITYFANEDSDKQNIRDWWEGQPTRQPAEKLPLPKALPNLPALVQPAALTINQERAIRSILGRQADAVLDLLRVSADREWRTVLDLAGGNDARRRKFERALDDYGAIKFFEVTPDGWLVGAFGHDDPDLSSPFGGEAQIPDRRDQRLPQAESRRLLYRLRSTTEIKPILLDMLAAHLADKHEVPRFNRHQIAALGVGDDTQGLADAINARVDAHLTEAERADRDKALGKAVTEYRRWERDLDDITVAPVIVGAGGTPVEQTVARVLVAVGSETTWNKVELAAAIPKARLRRILPKLGKTTEERYTADDAIVTQVEGLPTEYDTRRGGYPARAVTDDGELLNLRSPKDRPKAYAALGRGESLRIRYVSGITIRDLTADEIEQRDQPKEKKPRKDYARTTSQPAQVQTLGADMTRIVRLIHWAEVVCKLPNGPALTSVQRLYRLAGRENMYTPVSEMIETASAIEITSGAQLDDFFAPSTQPIQPPPPIEPEKHAQYVQEAARRQWAKLEADNPGVDFSAPTPGESIWNFGRAAR